jgi:hypothetical protein
MLLKSPKLPGANFPVVKNCPMKADGLNHVTEVARELVPHIVTRKSRVQPKEILITSAKRLFQQHR